MAYLLSSGALIMDYARAYTQMHEEKPKLFAGHTLKRYVKPITTLVNEAKPTRILDYGSGKGYQYLEMRLHEQWGGLLPHCFDVGVRQLSKRPEGKFDGIICTDMMEHIEEKDVVMILSDIFSFSSNTPNAFAFFGICCRPSKKTLPDGRDAHLCIKPRDWWERVILATTRRVGFVGVWQCDYEDHDHG